MMMMTRRIKKLGKISDLDRILVSARNDLHGVQALERAQLGEDLPHGDRLGEVEDYVALAWAYIIIVIVTLTINIVFGYICRCSQFAALREYCEGEIMQNI